MPDPDLTPVHTHPLRADPRHFAILPSAGTGTRLGADRPKQYLHLGERTVLEQSVACMLAVDWIAMVVVVVAPGDAVAGTLAGLREERVRIVDAGGATRRETVLGGLNWLSDHGDALPDDWVHVHDAARPGLDVASLERLRAALEHSRLLELPGALLALPMVDTVKRAEDRQVRATVDRRDLWLAQTPQSFRHRRLLEAIARHPDVTDESSAIEADGGRPILVEGSRKNFKITTAEDLAMMRLIFAACSAV